MTISLLLAAGMGAAAAHSAQLPPPVPPMPPYTGKTPAPPAPPHATPPLPPTIFVPPVPDVELQRHLRSRRMQPARLRFGYITDDDYPAAALRVEAQGRSVIRYTIGPDGRVASCELVQSAGHPALDEVSCALVSRRFVFFPALGRNGRPTTETRTQGIVWRLPECGPEPMPPPPPK